MEKIILFIVILSLLVLIHEWGHFFVARRNKMKVEEFGIGFPPRIFGKKRGGTVFSINAIPLGGFVKIFGEDEDYKDKNGSFTSKSIPRRISVVVAGVLMNFLVAWLLLTLVFIIGVFAFVPENSNNSRHINNLEDRGMFVRHIIEGSATEKAGIELGDKIIQLSSDDLSVRPQDTEAFNQFIQKEKGNTVQFEYKRKDVIHTTQMEIKKIHTSKEGVIGVVVEKGGTIKYPPHTALWAGLKETGQWIKLMMEGLGSMIGDIFKKGEVPQDVAGPVGIVKIAGQMQDLGLVYYLQFIAMISLNLAILNILPIPALDGGRLIFLIIEAIKGSPVNKKTEKYVHIAGFALLMLLILLVTIRDIIDPVV